MFNNKDKFVTEVHLFPTLKGRKFFNFVCMRHFYKEVRYLQSVETFTFYIFENFSYKQCVSCYLFSNVVSTLRIYLKFISLYNFVLTFIILHNTLRIEGQKNLKCLRWGYKSTSQRNLCIFFTYSEG